MNEKKKKDIVFGLRSVIETIESGKEIDRLFLQKQLSGDLMIQLKKIVKSRAIPVSIVPIEKLNRITRKNHQGAIAFISSIEFSSLDFVVESVYKKGKEPFLLLLDRITDVRNFGAITRSAECAGVDAIIVPSRGSAALNADAMKTSAGALNYVPICREENLKNTIRDLKNQGISMFACTQEAETFLHSSDYNKPLCLILGSEEDGISDEYLKMVDQKIKIPMYGNIQSLNVAASAAIVCFEVVRQRNL